MLDVHFSYVRALPTGAVVLLDRLFLLPEIRKGPVPWVAQIPVIVGPCERCCLWQDMSLTEGEMRRRLLSADCSSCLQCWAVLPLFLRKRSSSLTIVLTLSLPAACLDTRRGRGRGHVGCAIQALDTVGNTISSTLTLSHRVTSRPPSMSDKVVFKKSASRPAQRARDLDLDLDSTEPSTADTPITLASKLKSKAKRAQPKSRLSFGADDEVCALQSSPVPT